MSEQEALSRSPDLMSSGEMALLADDQQIQPIRTSHFEVYDTVEERISTDVDP